MKKSDKIRFDKLKELGCVACGSNNVVIHHIRKHTGLSLRPDHQDTFLYVQCIIIWVMNQYILIKSCLKKNSVPKNNY